MLLLFGFILGLVTILAEPAVNVLTHQIKNVTSGYVNRKIVIVSLCLGAGAAVALSMIRILVHLRYSYGISCFLDTLYVYS